MPKHDKYIFFVISELGVLIRKFSTTNLFKNSILKPAVTSKQ